MMVGTQIGAYRVLQQIGEGGMGSVWMAEHTMLGRRAAIKVLHPSFSHQPAVVQRFFNEARAATAISDPGIVQIFDFGQAADGSAYIVMELIEGETLDKRLLRLGRLPVTEALRVLRQVASSLSAAHSRGIVHRDLKPENIFVVRDNEVAGGERAKIVDFGIAKLVGDSSMKTQTSAVMGTPTYMSPEQCRGAGQVDHRSDIYAMGCVLFTLLTGKPPFDADGIGEIIAMHLREPAPSPSSRAPGIAPQVDQLVLRCLAKDPAQRFGSAGELAAAMGVLLGTTSSLGAQVAPITGSYASSPSTLSAATGSQTVNGQGKKGSGVLIGVGLAAVVAIGGGIFVATRSSSNAKQVAPAAEPKSAPVAAPTPAPVAAPTPAPAPVVAPTPPAPVAVPPPPVEPATPPVETKPVETKPVETKPVETKPAATKPVATKPAHPVAKPAPKPTPQTAKPIPVDENGIPIQR